MLCKYKEKLSLTQILLFCIAKKYVLDSWIRPRIGILCWAKPGQLPVFENAALVTHTYSIVYILF